MGKVLPMIWYSWVTFPSIVWNSYVLYYKWLGKIRILYLQNYDIVIWSATSMKWIEEKMKLLGCDRHPGYKLAFYLDSRAMISIHTEKYGVIEVNKVCTTIPMFCKKDYRLIRDPYNMYTLIYSILNLLCIFKNTTFCLFNFVPKSFYCTKFFNFRNTC